LAGKTVEQLAVGYAHTCVVTSDDQVYCWGANGSGQLGDSSTTDRDLPVLIPSSRFGNKPVVAIAAGGSDVATSHTCALTNDGMAYCWGYGLNGRLGNNATTNKLIPTAVTNTGALAGVTYTSIVAGYDQTCATSVANDTYCWGANASGQLANNAVTDKLIPTPIFSPSAFAGVTYQTVAAGGQHTCALGSDDKAYCWGNGGAGRLGGNSTASTKSPAPVFSGAMGELTVSAIATGINHTCAIASDNNAYCWGAGTNGQLGNSASTNQTAPVAVTHTTGALSGKTVKAITTGNAFTCAIASDNKAYCWGNGVNGRLGDNTTTSKTAPVAVYGSGVLSGKTIKAISAGSVHACAIASDDNAYCWGSGGNGQLGNNAATVQIAPVAVDKTGVLSGLTIKQISGGGNFTCAIASDDQAYCWGAGGNGQLGNNSTTNSRVPVAVNTSGVLNGKTLVSITTGFAHACVTDSDDGVYCWGANGAGQLGNNSTVNSLVPVAAIMTGALAGETVLQISAGGTSATVSHTCVTTINDTTAVHNAHCWGSNSNGQLGDNSATNKTVPSTVHSVRIELPFTVTLDIEGTPAECEEVSIAANGRSITCVTTAHASGLVSVTIDDGIDFVTMANAYTYRNDSNLTISGISPKYGTSAGDSEVTITGTNFSAGMTVIFDTAGDAETCQNVTFVSLSELTCETPAHAAGLVSVTLDNGTTTATLDPLWIDASDPHYEDNILSGFLYQDPPYMSIGVGKATINISCSPVTSGCTVDSDTVSVRTNLRNGYELYISTDSSNSNLTHVSLGDVISPVAGSLTTPSALTTDTWGFSLSSGGTAATVQWAAVPNVTSGALIKDSPAPNETALGDQTTLQYSANISVFKPVGQYATNVVYTAVGNI
jgi:alpha-tubulin suppressor-like RCC1 family protein